MNRARDPRRALPAVGTLLATPEVRRLARDWSQAAVADAARTVLATARLDPSGAPQEMTHWVAAVAAELDRRHRRALHRTFNATGVVLHTNLGRAPLAEHALRAIREAAEDACNLELDLESGARGARSPHTGALLCALTGAEDALVVNNCAGALVLALDTLAAGRDVLVSRGELVEIGGSFRVPDIMAKSGARLVEVGTTNRTHLADYEQSLTARTGAIVKVHRSNFAMQGFVADVPLSALVALAEPLGVPVVHDFGAGLLVSLDAYGLTGEPTAQDSVRSGPALVLMSGDKLLGGPQAGIVVGRAAVIDRLRRNPLARALRVDKLTLAALEATLTLYLDPERAVREIPTLAMLTAPVDEIVRRAAAAAAVVGCVGRVVAVEESTAAVGAGAFPTARLPSAAVTVTGDAARLERTLRLATPPIVGRVAEERLWLDVRSIPPGRDEAFREALGSVLG